MTDKKDAPPQVKVDVLDKRNVGRLSRSIVTKETLIQQYLESLPPPRLTYKQKLALQTTAATAAVSTAPGDEAIDRSQRSPSPHTTIRTQPQMIGVNSSVVEAACHARQPASTPPTCRQEAEGNDMINLQPSVEAESSRFGVTLRNLELSSDSCSSAIEEDDDRGSHRRSLSPARLRIQRGLDAMKRQGIRLCFDDSD